MGTVAQRWPKCLPVKGCEMDKRKVETPLTDEEKQQLLAQVVDYDLGHRPQESRRKGQVGSHFPQSAAVHAPGECLDARGEG